MSKDRRMIQAYLDNELSVGEIIHFESQLSRDKRQKIEAERVLEANIARKLKADSNCPDLLWEKIKKDIHKKNQRKKLVRFYKWIGVAAIFLISLYSADSFIAKRSVEVRFSKNLETFLKSAEIHGNFEKVNDYIKNQGITLKIKDSKTLQTPHDIKILGASFIKGKDSYLKIYASCCGEQSVIVVTEKVLDLKLRGVVTKQYHVSSQKIQKYEVVAISPHNPENILALF